jgi:hypothetical protein
VDEVDLPHPGRADDGLSSLFDTMPAAFCLLDAQWRFRYLNA